MDTTPPARSIYAPHTRRQLADDEARAILDGARAALDATATPGSWRNVRVRTDGAGHWLTAGDPALGNRRTRRAMMRSALRG